MISLQMKREGDGKTVKRIHLGMKKHTKTLIF